jgi:hypothetical protein
VRVLSDTACSQCSPLCLLQRCIVLPVFRTLGTRNAGKHSLAFLSNPFMFARKRPLFLTSERATIAASAAHPRPLPDAARSVHYDVLKTSTLEMIPTDRCPPCILMRSILQPWPPRAMFLPLPPPISSHPVTSPRQLCAALCRHHRATRFPVQGPRQVRARDWRPRIRLPLPLQLPRFQRQ